MNPAILNFFMCLEEAVLLNYVCRVLPDIYGSLEEIAHCWLRESQNPKVYFLFFLCKIMMSYF